MKKSDNYKLYGIVLTFVVIVTASLRVNAQNTTVKPKIFDNEVQSKKPVLEAKLNQNNFRLGEVIELALTIKNETNSTISLFDIEPERSFDITVKNAKGTPLPLRQEGINKKYPAIIMAREGAYIEAGKKLEIRKVFLDKLFAFKSSGIYTLEIKLVYYPEDAFRNSTSSKNKGTILTSVLKFSIK